jgi:hypothetical protein
VPQLALQFSVNLGQYLLFVVCNSEEFPKLFSFLQSLLIFNLKLFADSGKWVQHPEKSFEIHPFSKKIRRKSSGAREKDLTESVQHLSKAQQQIKMCLEK